MIHHPHRRQGGPVRTLLGVPPDALPHPLPHHRPHLRASPPGFREPALRVAPGCDRGDNGLMRFVKGTVVGNTVVLEEALPEGLAVDVLVREQGDEFTLTDEMREELREAAAAARRGETLDLDEVLREVDW